ncbi:hypothetical protein Kpol_530p40 [Vanderwaltozyma polyspora DSM 70294]|uniref:Purine nucleoside phosphorylase n=1 Tax=Vanderwaltozyma polyspora (strain ATCC 22028 / DSM 70294 / BCRC 21397 / CBS 2163 / NBRC 10782 / NRRL Y-8283 / UCD 57-17) TaxID=436907 RepID=A7TL14_VANPO|nr:uncharacterized protein Kpol_530p40 [Vanderwaltozyma polyspora DSM 70294]EDO17070.1 hypothetical protein Kpol_530p40 [Vanderwaltozyma polyspora DSM 70294]
MIFEFDIDQQRKSIQFASTYLKDRLHEHFGVDKFKPRTLIICGSGLGGISNRISKDTIEPLIISYADIPGFKESTVPGHHGSMVFGMMNSSPVVLMSGRLHGYEGHNLFETTFPIRVLHHLSSVKNLIVTNAAGGVNPDFKVCDLMCIYDHINFPGLAGNHPLRGQNFDEYGPRFLALSDAYDLGLRKLLFKKQKELGIERPIHEGTYTFVSGPTFESRAEIRMMRVIGGDAVGMSTVPEVIVARHCGWKVLAISLITNECVSSLPASAHDPNPVPIDNGKATHDEVLENGKKASLDVERLVEGIVGEL